MRTFAVVSRIALLHISIPIVLSVLHCSLLPKVTPGSAHGIELLLRLRLLVEQSLQSPQVVPKQCLTPFLPVKYEDGCVLNAELDHRSRLWRELHLEESYIGILFVPRQGLNLRGRLNTDRVGSRRYIQHHCRSRMLCMGDGGVM